LLEVYRKITETLAAGRTAVLATVVDKWGSGPCRQGAAMLVLESGAALGTVGGGALEREVAAAAAKLMGGTSCLLQEYRFAGSERPAAPPGALRTAASGNPIDVPMLCGGGVVLFYQALGGAGEVVIFGAGHVGRAAARHLEPMDLHVTLVDDRKPLPEPQEPGGLAVRHVESYAAAAADLQRLDGAYCLIATHTHEQDYQTLKAVIECEHRPIYIGVIASARKARHFLDRLGDESTAPIPREILYMPCGLDIGGPAPDEIAVSVIAEIQAHRYGRRSLRHMRRRLDENPRAGGGSETESVEDGESP